VQEISESIFVEENEEDVDWGHAKPTSSAAPVESAMTTLAHGLDLSSSTTWGPHEPPPPEEATIVVEGRRLLQEKHLGTFSVATHLRP
jgi:hypothetical protein